MDLAKHSRSLEIDVAAASRFMDAALSERRIGASLVQVGFHLDVVAMLFATAQVWVTTHPVGACTG